MPRPGPPLAFAFGLGGMIVAIAVLGLVLSSQIESDPDCFEACFLSSWVPTTYATIFATSALVNLALLPLTLRTVAAPAPPPNLRGVVIWQVVLLGLAIAWVIGLMIDMPELSAFAGAGIAAISIVVCTLISFAISTSRAFSN